MSAQSVLASSLVHSHWQSMDTGNRWEVVQARGEYVEVTKKSTKKGKRKPKVEAYWWHVSSLFADYMRREYQTYALDRDGQLLHCGPRWLKPACLGLSTIRRLVREWESWADGIAKEQPDCPTAASRRKTAVLVIHPVGCQGRQVRFNVGGPRP
jgi:hypothetical protein